MTAFFAGAALLMAMLGVYGVVSYSVRQRTVEIGTRMALGATSRDVLSLIVGGGLKMAAYGVVAGGIAAIGGAFYLGRVFKIGELGPAPFLYSTAIVAAVAFTASFLPAWRAAAVVADGGDPQPAGVDVAGRTAEACGGPCRTCPAAPSVRSSPLGALISEFAGRGSPRGLVSGSGAGGAGDAAGAGGRAVDHAAGKGAGRRLPVRQHLDSGAGNRHQPAPALPASAGADRRRLRDMAAVGTGIPAGARRRDRALGRDGRPDRRFRCARRTRSSACCCSVLPRDVNASRRRRRSCWAARRKSSR